MSTELRDQLQTTMGDAYRLERELGGGGMSRVFVAEDTALGRKVVVKVISPELAAGVSNDRFRREILLAAQLQHPHIVPVLTAGQTGGLPYFTMPFIEGRSLRARLDGEHALPVVEAVGILRDVARALAYAHEHGVVHRDIKPDNVLLSGGSAVVTDFGIAKAISSARAEGEGGTLTMVGTSLGTPSYMAPEQVAADPSADHRADMYAYGVMAYEILTGKTPFHGRSPQALLTAHLTETPAPLAQRAPEVPATLAALVMRCLAKNPEDRPQNATELLQTLDRLDVSGDWRVPTGAVVPRRRPRRAVIAGVAALVAVLLVAGFLLARRWMTPDRAVAADVVAVVPFRVASADASLHYLREGMLDL
ncbi:MAG TPA: serine/threonine-protein kinase, partial [Gemmatimonadaceae bacterium]|nr:serine/threonine-protein kinase [Gemmatimonadaceae bacterium]